MVSDKMVDGYGMGVDSEIVKEFEGKYIYMRKYGGDRVIIAYLKKAGDRSALFVSPTKQITFVVLYEDISMISVHNGMVNLPEGKVDVVNGIIKNECVVTK